MLIASPRHARSDIKRWQELESADFAHGATRSMEKKIEQSIGEIRKFAKAGQFYISVSGGKDSAVLSMLAEMAAVSVPRIHIHARRFANPDNQSVLCRFPCLRTIPIEYPDRATEADKDRAFFAALSDCGQRYASGIRGEESGGRKIRMRAHGCSTANTCAPIGWWKSMDVFGFLAMYGGPVHPAYAMLGGDRWNREHIRVDEIGGERGTQFGRREWEQEYYPDVANQLKPTNRCVTASPLF